MNFVPPDVGPVFTIKTKHNYFTTDNLGNIYAVNDDELLKYLANGKFFNRYSNLKLGSITSVDAVNPLKILLYYRDFQQIVFLDNQLTSNSDNISLEALGHEQTELVCASANNSFWIYDKQNNELTRFNENSKKTASTGNLKQILQSELNPNFMLEYNNYLYLNCPQTGIYVFDIFGAYSKLIALKNIQKFRVNDDLIYYQKDSSICSYNHKLFEEGCKPILNGSGCKSVEIGKRLLYLSYSDSIAVVNL
ncbi:MAG: hypothetical protein IPM51_15530 [Sphingobacteriaceae bacterium]|nr:hypothetical protein [Sphingobacteriaceae bacterium]